MESFATWVDIAFFFFEICEEEAEKCIPTKHIANVIVAHHHKCENSDKEKIFFILNQSLNRICEKWKKE